ncbi:MAG: hypothetical protein E7568_02025 [Ruminococcaceae bacterium]|nr:hypothetical protein [Oscillospiraceae bacterium]
MRLPEYDPNRERKFFITHPDGTITKAHPVYHSADKLNDSLNVFNETGILTTRKGFLKTKNGHLVSDITGCDNSSVFYSDFPFTKISGYNKLCMVVREFSAGITSLDFLVLDDDGNAKHLFMKTLASATGYTMFQIINATFIPSVVNGVENLYLVMPLIRVNVRDGTTEKEVQYYRFNEDFSDIYRDSGRDFYIPLFMKNGHGNAVIVEDPLARTPTQYPEGINVLNGAFEACFHVDEASDLYSLPIAMAKDSPVEIHYYTSTVSYKTFKIGANETESDSQPLMDYMLSFKVDKETGSIYPCCNGQRFALPCFITDNSLRIFAYTDVGDDAFEILSRRSGRIAFDGRFLIPGGEDNGGKIYYSGKNQPLYFAKENHITIGDSFEEITALSKQNRYLIAFKKSEIYRLSLTETTLPDREEALHDLNFTKMPQPKCTAVRINSTIGCDRPLTIETCGNRLVWYHSSGKVYTLYGSNLYSDGSVYELSSEISDRLSSLTSEEKSGIFATKIMGRYALVTKDNIFVMESLVSGFTYLSGHKTPNKDYGGLSWFLWQPPENMTLLSSFDTGGKEFFILSDKKGSMYHIAILSGYEDTIYSKIDGSQKTSYPKYSVTSCLFGVDDKRPDRLKFDINIEWPAQAEVFDINGYSKTYRVGPCCKFIQYIIPLSRPKGKIGLKLSGEGFFSLEYIFCSVTD